MIQFSNQEIANEHLILDSATELYYLGHHLTLRGCTVVISVPARALVIARTRFVGCTIHVKRQLNNFSWESVYLQDCRFKGRFSGNDFGERPFAPGEGRIQDCDFTEATLHGTRFFGCDVRSLRFPSWPCFTIVDPLGRARELRALPWPELVGRITIETVVESPPSTAAVTLSALELAKKFGTTPEALRAVVETIRDGIYY